MAVAGMAVLTSLVCNLKPKTRKTYCLEFGVGNFHEFLLINFDGVELLQGRASTSQQVAYIAGGKMQMTLAGAGFREGIGHKKV